MDTTESIQTNASLEIKEELNTIAENLKKGKAQFLFGAGMARDFKLPLGAHLSKSLTDELLFSEVFRENDKPSEEEWGELLNSFPFEAIIDGVLKKDEGGRKKLISSLKEKLISNASEEQSESAYEILNTIINKTNNPKLLLTTNFDNLFEERMGGNSEPVTKDNFHKIDEYLKNEKTPILHLHGYLGDLKDNDFQNGCELTISEKDVYAENYNPMMREFEKNLYQADSFVFVGYSLNDPNIKQIYRHYSNDIQTRIGRNKKTYVVSPPKNKFFDFLAKKVWDARNIIWLPYTAKDFFNELLQTYDSLRSREVKKKVKEKYGKITDSDDLVNEKIKSTQKILGVDQETALEFLNLTIK